MEWLDWIFLLLLVVTTVKIARFVISNKHHLTIALLITSLLVSANFLSLEIAELLTDYGQWSEVWNINEWLEIAWIAFFLAALALVIRHVKPEFARFPRAFAILPLLIVPTHYLGINSLVLKQWVVAIYLGGAIIISFLLSSVWIYRDRAHWKTFVAIILFMISFILKWNPFFDFEAQWSNFPLSVVLNSVGIIFLYKGFTTTLSLVLYPNFDSKTGTVNDNQQ